MAAGRAEDGRDDDVDRVQELEQEVQQLKEAVDSHAVVDQAIGMMVAMRGLAFPGQASGRLFYAAIRNFSYSAWTSRGGR